MTHDLPPEPVRSCPALNWMKRPGEPVRYFEMREAKYQNDHDRWVEITPAEAWRIAYSK
jgi:hypothetical protein